MKGQPIVKANTFAPVGILGSLGQTDKIRDSQWRFLKFQPDQNIPFLGGYLRVKPFCKLQFFTGKALCRSKGKKQKSDCHA